MSHKQYKAELWSEEKFSSCKDEWSALLAVSDANPFFMSWDWMYTWWESFSHPEYTLMMIAVYSHENKLLGVAPLYLSPSYLKRIIKIRRLQFVGRCWHGTPNSEFAMRTEYLDFIIKRDEHEAVLEAIFSFIDNNLEWDEFTIQELNKKSPSYAFIKKQKYACRWVDEYKSYLLPLASNFAQYVAALGKNTRLQVFNRRKLLEKKGEVAIHSYTGEEIDTCFSILDDLHVKRWGYPVFTDSRMVFNKKLAACFAKSGQLHFIVLLVNDVPQSIQYNYCVNGTEYNIQAGFNPDFDKKLRLGYLMFGYAIEHAYHSGMQIYHFLAGAGQNAEYKERLTKQSETMVDVQLVRSNWLKFLYRFYDRIM